MTNLRVKANPPIRLEIEYKASSVPGEGDLPVVQVFLNDELAFTGCVPRQLNGSTTITATFDQLKPGAILMKIVVFDYATADHKDQFNGWSMIEAYDSQVSLFGGLLEPTSPDRQAPAYAADPTLVYSTKEQEIAIEWS